jgi:hypothetical protein
VAPRAAAAAILAAVLTAFAGCGGGEPEAPDEPPAELLREAAATPPASGQAELDLALDLEGQGLLAGPSSVAAEGPFDHGDGGLPRFELSGEAEVGGFGIEGAVVSTGDDLFVDFFGELYRVGSARVAAAESRLAEAGGAGLDVAAWIADPTYGEIEEVGGADAQEVQGTLQSDAVAASTLVVLAEVVGAPGLLQAAAQGARPGPAEVWIALDDTTVRRVRVELPFTVPSELLVATRGITGGTVDLEVEIGDVGAEVEIEPPAGGGFKPIESLISELRGLARLGGL